MIEGALSLLAGLRLLLGTPELRAILWRMAGLLFVLMVLLTGGVFWLAGYMAHLWLPQGDAWYWQVLTWMVWLVAAVLALFTGAVGYTALGSAAAAPWLDSLAARTEVLSGKQLKGPDTAWWRLVLQSLANSVRPLSGLLGMGALALVLLFIPVVGQTAAVLIWGYAGIRFLNFELMDVPASRRGWDFSRRKSELQRRRFFYLGFGGIAMVLLLVPFLNLFVLPAAVTGLSRNLA